MSGTAGKSLTDETRVTFLQQEKIFLEIAEKMSTFWDGDANISTFWSLIRTDLESGLYWMLTELAVMKSLPKRIYCKSRVSRRIKLSCMINCTSLSELVIWKGNEILLHLTLCGRHY